MGIVALHPEGVDRNIREDTLYLKQVSSPSTRRAWIEITTDTRATLKWRVALHPEGVDRNWRF